MALHAVPEAFSLPILDSTSTLGTNEAQRRIGNSLSVIACIVDLQAATVGALPGRMDRSEVSDMLEQVGTRIEAVARLYRNLADRPDGTVELHHYLHELCDAAVSSGSRAGRLKLHFDDGPPCHVGAEQALSVGFIIGELVTNAIRYAHPTGIPGQLHVDCGRCPDGKIVIAVSDDGVGLPEGFDPQQSGHLGMRIIHSLAKQLTARVTFESGPLGLTVLLQLPSRVIDGSALQNKSVRRTPPLQPK